MLVLALILVLSPTKITQPNASGITRVEQIEKDYLCLVEVLYFEARGEPKQGMKAVASVVYNRTKAKGYPSDYCGVVQQPKQFSYRNKLGRSTKVIKPIVKPSEQKIYADIRAIAFEAAVGALKHDLPKDVVFYQRKELRTKWAKDSKFVVTIGNHSFFKS
jgi:N-acetylmuramoyl-L-alanine amidase